MNETFPDLPVLATLGESLTVSFRDAEHRAGAASPRRRWRPRTRFTPLFAALLVVVVGTGALAATNVIRIGSPAPSGKPFSNPHRGAGAIIPHSVRLLDIKAADPVTGPPWGMRVLSTTRGVGCIQVGRLLDGRLGLLGTAGAFHNDGLFHPMPANSSFSPVGCTTLDRNGRIFLAVHIDYMPASATESCFELHFFRGGRKPTPACASSDERTLDYGLLGPQAASITYRTAHGMRTRPTVGPEGAYLIVRRGVRQWRSDAAGGGLLPLNGPITALTYRDGSVCHLPAHGRPYPDAACKPHGYAALATRLPSPQQVRAPVHVRIKRPRRHGRHGLLEVSFVARVPVTSARGSYVVTWYRGPRKRTWYQLQTSGDVRVGQTIRKRLMVMEAGTYHGSVSYTQSRGPDEGFPGSSRQPRRLVGTFTIEVR